jgi:hypothetical protein
LIDFVYKNGITSINIGGNDIEKIIENIWTGFDEEGKYEYFPKILIIIKITHRNCVPSIVRISCGSGLKITNEIVIGELNIKLYIILVRIFSIKNFFGDWLKIQTKYFSSDL